MAWGSKLCVVIRDETTGETDSTSALVELQPANQAYDTGAIVLAQKTVDQYVWGLASDSLDDDTHYKLYLDGSYTGIIIPAPNSYFALGA